MISASGTISVPMIASDQNTSIVDGLLIAVVGRARKIVPGRAATGTLKIRTSQKRSAGVRHTVQLFDRIIRQHQLRRGEILVQMRSR
jgi:hypothetical protein